MDFGVYSVCEVVDDDLKFLGYHFLELVRRHVGSEVVVLCEGVDLLFEFVGGWVGHGGWWWVGWLLVVYDLRGKAD